MSQHCWLNEQWKRFFICLTILGFFPTAIPQPILSTNVKAADDSINYENLQGPIGAGDGTNSYASSLLLLRNRKSHRNKDNVVPTNTNCNNIALSGSASYQKITNGIYVERGIHSGRHFYLKENENQLWNKYLYWDDDYQRWCVSSALGSKVVNLRSVDSLKLPNEITRSWESWNGEKGKFVLESQIRTFCTSMCSCEHGVPESSCFIVGAPKCKSCFEGFHLNDLECMSDSILTFKNDSMIGVKKIKSNDMTAVKKIKSSHNMTVGKKIKSKNNILFRPLRDIDLSVPDDHPEEDLPHRRQKNIGTPSINVPCFLLPFFCVHLINVWL